MYQPSLMLIVTYNQRMIVRQIWSQSQSAVARVFYFPNQLDQIQENAGFCG
jgi:hypothetical protein